MLSKVVPFPNQTVADPTFHYYGLLMYRNEICIEALTARKNNDTVLYKKLLKRKEKYDSLIKKYEETTDIQDYAWVVLGNPTKETE